MNFFNQLQSLLQNLIVDHWLKLIWFPIAALILWVWKRRRDRVAWQKRQFLERVNCSLNFIEGGFLKIRTLFEVRLSDILLDNQAMREIVLAAARQTSTSDAFVRIGDSDDQWHVLNAGLNEIAERYSVGNLALDMGMPVERAWYVFGWTCERDDDVRVRKLRLMVASRGLLEGIMEGSVEQPGFESQSHDVRWKTLHQMAAHFRDGKNCLMKVEVVLPSLQEALVKPMVLE